MESSRFPTTSYRLHGHKNRGGISILDSIQISRFFIKIKLSISENIKVSYFSDFPVDSAEAPVADAEMAFFPPVQAAAAS